MKIKRVLKYLLLAVLVGFVGFLYSFTSVRNDRKKVPKPEVKFEEGVNNFLTHSMVDKLLIQNGETVENQAKSVINLYSLENSICENPYVEKATVFLTVGGVLKSIVKQRTVIARIISNKGSFYVDRHGVKIPLSTNYTARVMLVSGVEDDKDIQVVLPLISYILKDDFLQKEIVAIEKYNVDEYRFSVRSGDYKIDFGKLETVKLKFDKLKAFYNTTYKNKTIQEYKMITLKYHNQVVCTK